MKNCRIVIFVTKCTEKVVKYLYFHGKIAVFQNPQERARGNQSLRPCFSGSPDPNGPQKFCEMLVTVFEASKVLCLAVRPRSARNSASEARKAGGLNRVALILNEMHETISDCRMRRRHSMPAP